MKKFKKVIGLLLMFTFLISSVGIGLDTIMLKAEVPKSSVDSFDAGVFRRPAPNITLDVTEVTRVGSNNTNMGSGNTIRKATVSGVPEVSGTYAAQALAGETAYWPVVIFSSSAAVNITGISFTGVTGISTTLTGNLSNTTYAKWEITGGTATAGTTIKATISYTYTWLNVYTGVNVTDDYTIDGYSYVENIIFPATEWVFQARYQGGSGNAADVIYVQRLLGKGVYGDPISLNVTTGEYLSGYFDVSTNLWVNDNDGTIPKRVGLKADPARQNGGGGGSYANGTGAYPGDTHRIRSSVYLDISLQTLQKNNFRSHNYLQQAIRCSSGWQHYDALRVKDGNVAFTNPGDQGDGAFGSISNDSGAAAALNPAGGTSSSTNLNAAGAQVTTTFFGNGGGTSVGSNEYTLLTKWKAKGKKNLIWDSDPYLCVYKGITIGITRFDKATLRSYLNYAIGTSTANTVTGSQNVTTIATANGADPDNPGTITTFKGKNPQSWYYASGWSDYSTAYENAWSQIVKPNTNQTAIDSAAGNASSGLYNAYINGLTLERANYTSLEELIAQVEAHNTGNLVNWPDTAYYTTASANALTEAYDAAIASRTASATGYSVLYQPYVDYLAKTLQDAINGLTYASFSLVFDANGGTGGTSSTLFYGDPVVVPTVIRTGYAFAGWAEGTPPATMPNSSLTYTAQWAGYSYTVAFDGNGATGGSTASASHTSGVPQALTSNGFERTGWSFTGWATSPGGGYAYANGETVVDLATENGATVTLYAVWTQNNYNYIFVANGGTGGTSGTLHYGDPVVVPTVTKPGYTFGGWAEGTPPATMPANNIFFTAVWFVRTYTVTYDGNGADGGSTANSAHTYDIPKALTANGYTNTGQTFAGWATEPGGAVIYTNGQSVINLTGENTGTVTLYAKWSPIDYLVTFDANGGTGGTIGTLHYGDTVVVPTLSRTGYTFIGWGEGEPPLTMPPEPIIYSAVWIPNNYTVVYNGNGATSGSTASTSHTYDTAKTLTANGFTRIGATFAGGWSTTPGGAVQYTNGQSVINLTGTAGGTVTLYAVWNLINYNYTFNANGGTGGTSGTLHYGDPVVVPAVTRTGYTFTGWAEGTPPATMPTNAISYTAQWSINSYDLTFDANGGTGGTGPDSTVYNTPISAPTLTRTGFTFTGWSPSVPANMPAADTVYTAQWSRNNYTITFNANGGTGGTSGPMPYEDPLSAPAVARTGYTLTEWSPAVPATVPLGGGTYTAQWVAHNYTVEYDANGGTGSTAGTAHTYDAAQALTLSGFVRIGYTFAGWAASAGGAALYADGQSVSNLTAIDEATVTLYAKWAANSYTISYLGNGSTGGSTAASSHSYDLASTLTANGFAKTGNSFLGWATVDTAETAEYTDGESVLNLTAAPDDIITFYAVWSVNYYDLTFDAAGGTGGTGPVSTKYNTPISAPEVTREGHTFTGWSPIVPAAMPAADTVYTAQWSLNSYNLTYDANGGTGGSGPDATEYGTALTAPEVTREGYTLTGWSPAVPAAMPAADAVYTAQWSINSYNLTYDANGGTGGSGPAATEYGTALTAPEVMREGYTFTGWSPVVPAAMPAADAVYTAQWSVNSYNLTYDANGGTGGTGPNATEYGTALTPPEVTREGYTLTGWSPVVPATMPAADAVYTAQWSINSYNLTYDANGGTGGSGPAATEYGTALTAPEVTREGHTFTGWSPVVPATMPAADTVYTAQWSTNSYTITFNANGGTGGTNSAMEYGSALAAPEVTREGYTLTGWAPAVPATVPAADTTYTAQWTAIKYNITFDANGGSGGWGPAEMDYDAVLTAPEVTRTGYTLTGWSPAVPATVQGTATYTAQWSINTYNITFDANGGTGGSGPTAMTYGEVLSAPVVAKEGSVFQGWSPAVPATVPAANTTYTALWIKTAVTVTKLETGLEVNIQGWTAGTQYQIWSYQKVTSDTLLDDASNVPANQWILSQAYTPGSGGDAQPDGSISFTIADFVSPDPNYTIAVRMADASGNFLTEMRDAYTPEDVAEVVITKVLVDGAVTTGFETKEIASGSRVLLKVLCNNVAVTQYTATVVGGPTEVALTLSNTNEFVWDTAGLQPGKYSVNVMATNGATSDCYVITFTLYSESAGYGSISTMTLTPGAGTVGITPDSSNGTFSYRVREPGRAPIYRSAEFASPGTIQHALTAYGVYHIAGYVTRAGVIGSESSYDDGIIKTYTVNRSETIPSTAVLTANVNLNDPVAKGTEIRFTATASIGGIGATPVEYSFWRYDAKGMVLVKDWSSENFLDWTPARVGEYTIQARVKGVDAGSYEAMAHKAVSVTNTGEPIADITNITITNLAELSAAASARKPVIIKASAAATNGEDLLYKFYVYDSDMRVIQLQGYSANQNCLWIPREAREYTLSVLVKNQASFGRYDAIGTFSITVS